MFNRPLRDLGVLMAAAFPALKHGAMFNHPYRDFGVVATLRRGGKSKKSGCFEFELSASTPPALFPRCVRR